ncbi:hypothetical protein L7F22_056993 [Adiantum nelumboides]|nr:hypothetical protein [Adiantum nelumboides]
MADKGKDKLPVEESSSSTRRHRRETATVDTQFMASARTAARTARAPRPSMTAEEQEENDLFTAQLMSMMGTFEQLAKNPQMQKLLKTKDYRTGSQAETSQQATNRQRQVTEPVERVPTVVTGPMQHVTQAQNPARNGHRSNEQSTHPTIPMRTSFPGYFGVLVDDFSRYTWVSFLKLKSEAFGSIRDWKAMVEKEKDLKVKSIRSDRGGEFLSENFARWCKSEGIRRQLTTPYTPSQNGVVERKNRTIMEMARAMLAHASLPRSYWAEACNTAVYIQNRSPTHALQDMTPFQAYYGRKPTVSHFRVFGCSAFVHIPKEKRQKLDFKSKKLLFLGYSAESDAYRLYDPDTRTTTVSRDVVFDESFITSAEGAAPQPIPILPPPSLPDPPASPVITPSTSHPVPPIQPPDVSPDHALSDSDSDLDVADATPEVDSAPPRREKRIPGWLYSTGLNLDCMKGEYPDSVEFSTPYNLAMAGEPGHYIIRDHWLLYKGRLCITAGQRAALLHDAHDSLVGGHRGINSTLEKLERSVDTDIDSLIVEIEEEGGRVSSDMGAWRIPSLLVKLNGSQAP